MTARKSHVTARFCPFCLMWSGSPCVVAVLNSGNIVAADHATHCNLEGQLESKSLAGKGVGTLRKLQLDNVMQALVLSSPTYLRLGEGASHPLGLEQQSNAMGQAVKQNPLCILCSCIIVWSDSFRFVMLVIILLVGGYCSCRFAQGQFIAPLTSLRVLWCIIAATVALFAYACFWHMPCNALCIVCLCKTQCHCSALCHWCLNSDP